ncbi:hypothetical protein [Serpentinicella alkaliphila]|uniref:Uncharacterized protein n=1 Tax=Serpentinicella alkaliphila TaxID=1734049 RepID=A0A4R2T9L2_9FIRM|nr:hypothetical protein [Serpentinicella alkaliphila]QUH25605.1 hypothetical protein HZR23_07555 [Serpentinicella alkaliphila]TCP98386.1 hypothetical protein EDD79_104222 [Serpentinicella alkaliphila]
MKKKYIFIILSIVLTLGLVTVVQGQENVEYRNRYGQYCYENENMISTMRDNGFEEMAVLMENKDRDGMRELMKNMTWEDYTNMQKIMNENGYSSGNMKRMSNRMFSGFKIGNRCR